MVGDCFDVWQGLRGGTRVWGDRSGRVLPIGELGPIGSLIVSASTDPFLEKKVTDTKRTGMTTEIE